MKNLIAICDSLQTKGISSRRLMAVRYGEDRLKNDCDIVECSDEQHNENR